MISPYLEPLTEDKSHQQFLAAFPQDTRTWKIMTFLLNYYELNQISNDLAAIPIIKEYYKNHAFYAIVYYPSLNIRLYKIQFLLVITPTPKGLFR